MRYLIGLAFHTYRLLIIAILAVMEILIWIVCIPQMIFELRIMGKFEQGLAKKYDQYWP